MVWRTRAILSEIEFTCAVCVGNALVDIPGGHVVNCGVVRMEGEILALRPPWSKLIINDLIMGGNGTNSTDFYRKVATYFLNLRILMILDAF